MDRLPKVPPFPVGARVRYVGPGRSWSVAKDGSPVAVVEPGTVVTVDETRAGRRGTLRQLRDVDGPMEHEDGEPILDTTRDGYSLYHYEIDGYRHGRIVTPETWELVQ